MNPVTINRRSIVAVLVAISLFFVALAGASQLSISRAYGDEPAPAAQEQPEVQADEAADSAGESSGQASCEEGSEVQAQSDVSAQIDDETLEKIGTLTITNTITDSWEGDDRAFESWFELGDQPYLGDLSLTVIEKDGTVHDYVLHPDSDDPEDCPYITKKTREKHTGNDQYNVFYAILLKDGDTARVAGVPKGTHYQCYVYDNDRYTTGYNHRYDNVYDSVTTGGTSGSLGYGNDPHLSMINRRYAKVIPVVKVVLDGTNNPTSFPFRVTLLEEDNATPIANYRIGRASDGTELITDENGQVKFSVPTGSAVLLFAPAHSYYNIEELDLDEDRYVLNNVELPTSGFVDKLHSYPCYFVNVEKHELSVEKQDEEGSLIAGAKMQVLDDQGEVVEEWTSESGSAQTIKLPFNQNQYLFKSDHYVLHEVEAPAGYEIAEDTTFTFKYDYASQSPKLLLEDGTEVDKLVMIDEELPRHVTVSKSWKDEDDEAGRRPSEVKIQLLADGEASGEPVVLNAGNEWTYTWEGLAWHKDGQEIQYTVEEVEVPAGYTSTVEGDADSGFSVVNEYSPEKKQDEPAAQPGDSKKDATPKTGDVAPLGGLAFLVMAAAGCAFVLRRRAERG